MQKKIKKDNQAETCDILDDWHLESMKMTAHKKKHSWVDKRSLLSVKMGPNLKPNVKMVY